MSMYNMLFGVNRIAPFLLSLLDLDEGSVGRFRDAFLNKDGTEIYVYTRNGGGNREHYMPDFSGHPQYVSDEDDDFDSTYATIVFKVPEKYLTVTRAIAPGVDPAKIHEKFSQAIDEMKTRSAEDLRADPRFKPIVDIMEQISKAKPGEGPRTFEI